MRIIAINMWGQLSTGNIASGILKTFDGDKKFFYKYGKCSEDFAQKICTTIFSKIINRIETKIAKHFLKDGFGNSYATLRLIRQIKKYKPDVVHLHNLHGIFVNVPMLLKFLQKSKIPVVWTLHDCWTFTGHCGYFDYVNCNKWLSGCQNCEHLDLYTPAINKNQVKKYYKLKANAINKLDNVVFVTPSLWLTELAKQSYLKDKQIITINNAIDLTNFKPVDNKTFDNVIDRSKKILLAVACPFSERKGYSDYIKFGQLIDKDIYQLVMVGVYPEQVQELKQYDIVGIPRTYNQVELAELYSLAYCFINMTYEEAFGLVNIEAMACGCPIISYATGGCVEIINERNGILVPKGNYKEILYNLDKIQDLKQNKQAIIDETIAKYSNEIMIQKYIDIYIKIIENSKNNFVKMK